MILNILKSEIRYDVSVCNYVYTFCPTICIFQILHNNQYAACCINLVSSRRYYMLNSHSLCFDLSLTSRLIILTHFLKQIYSATQAIKMYSNLYRHFASWLRFAQKLKARNYIFVEFFMRFINALSQNIRQRNKRRNDCEGRQKKTDIK